MSKSTLGRDTAQHFGPTEWSMSAAIALTWGSSFLFIAIAIDHVATGVVPVARLAFGAATLACFPAARRRIETADLKRIAVLGFISMTIPFYLYPLAEQTVSSSITGMINGSIPITTVVAAAILTRNMPSTRRIVAVCIGFVGIALISIGSVGEDKGASLHGVIFLLFATACYAFTSILSRELQVKNGTLPVLLWTQIAGLVFSLPLGLPAFANSEFAWSAFFALLLLGAVGTGLAYVLYGLLMVRAGAVRGVIGVFFTPIVATILGLLFRDEKVTILAVVGMCVVIAGAWLTSRTD
jgi:drug/metabolite transporter (DMT)-like permease